jgi:beta-lactamase regulating signal transducer with metallopeptidase domain
MWASISSYGLAFCTWVATYLAHSTLLLAGTWLLFRHWKNARLSTRELAWKAALIGGLITTPAQQLLDLPAALPNWRLELLQADAAHPPSGQPREAPPEVPDGANRPDAGPAARVALNAAEIWIFAAQEQAAVERASIERAPTLDASVKPAAASPEVPVEPAAASTAPSPEQPRAWPASALVFLGAAGGALIAFGLLRCGWQTWRLHRRLSRCVELKAGPARHMLDDLLASVPRQPEVRLLVSAEEVEPAAFGVRRWTILLPERALRELPPDDLRSLLAHELAHLVRRDGLWLCLSRFVCTCCAFQPMNYLALREWQRAAELRCDAWAVARTGRPLALARCLAEVAGWRLAAPVCPASLAVLGRTRLSERIERLLEEGPDLADPADGWSRTRDVLLLAAGLAALVTMMPQIELRAASRDQEQQREIRLATALSQRQQPMEAPLAPLPPPFALDVPPEQEKPTGDLAELLTILEQETLSLERELLELEPLLAEQGIDARAVRLARALRVRAAALHRERAALLRSSLWKFVGVAAPETAAGQNL